MVVVIGGGGGGGGGGRRNGGGGGGGGGNFDPAQFQQRMMDRYKEQLGFTNDTEWSAVEPLVKNVSDARMETARGMFGGFRRGGQGGGGNGGGRVVAAAERSAPSPIPMRKRCNRQLIPMPRLRR